MRNMNRFPCTPESMECVSLALAPTMSTPQPSLTEGEIGIALSTQFTPDELHRRADILQAFSPVDERRDRQIIETLVLNSVLLGRQIRLLNQNELE